MRHLAGLSQEELALSSRLDRAYVGGIERGEQNPSLTNILKLSDTLGATPSELFQVAEHDPNWRPNE